MQELDEAAKANNLIFMNEVDPGIDHMSAMKVIDAIKERWRNDSFESFCGGLLRIGYESLEL
jgi:hypothetical protein